MLAMLDALGSTTLGPKPYAPWATSDHSVSPRLSLANSEALSMGSVDVEDSDWDCPCGCRFVLSDKLYRGNLLGSSLRASVARQQLHAFPRGCGCSRLPVSGIKAHFAGYALHCCGWSRCRPAQRQASYC